jgi:hypothetical protein
LVVEMNVHGLRRTIQRFVLGAKFQPWPGMSATTANEIRVHIGLACRPRLGVGVDTSSAQSHDRLRTPSSMAS